MDILTREKFPIFITIFTYHRIENENWFIITCTLHQIIMYSNKVNVKLLAGKNDDPPIHPFYPIPYLMNELTNKLCHNIYIYSTLDWRRWDKFIHYWPFPCIPAEPKLTSNNNPIKNLKYIILNLVPYFLPSPQWIYFNMDLKQDYHVL